MKQAKLKGKLKQAPTGFVYLDVPDALVLGLLDAAAPPSIKKPPYWNKQNNKVGAHISVIYADEVNESDLKVKEVGNEYEYTISGMNQVNPHGWDKMKQVYFITVDCKDLEKIRKKYKLTPKLNGHEFHITYGVEPVSEARCSFKLSMLHEETPEGRGFKNTYNLGRRIAKAMRQQSTHGKFSIGSRNAKHQMYPPGPKILTHPVYGKPRLRKYFGLMQPHRP